MCGFYNLNALKGCSKCLKEFRTRRFGSKPDYSGYIYDYDLWPKRNSSVHIQQAINLYAAKTASERRSIEQSYGCKYSTLYELPAFDVHVVDPMHNLFVGLTKHTTKQWKETGILTGQDYILIQEKVDSMIVPSKIGRIPRKIASPFVAFTADEWMNWTLIYSLYALHGIFPNERYRCW